MSRISLYGSLLQSSTNCNPVLANLFSKLFNTLLLEINPKQSATFYVSWNELFEPGFHRLFILFQASTMIIWLLCLIECSFVHHPCFIFLFLFFFLKGPLPFQTAALQLIDWLRVSQGSSTWFDCDKKLCIREKGVEWEPDCTSSCLRPGGLQAIQCDYSTLFSFYNATCIVKARLLSDVCFHF